MEKIKCSSDRLRIGIEPAVGKGAKPLGQEVHRDQFRGPSVSTITAGDIALEVVFAMHLVRLDRNLADLRWGSVLEMREECRDWCVSPPSHPLSHPLSLRSQWVLNGILWRCRFLLARSKGVLFNPYASEDRTAAASMVARMGKRAGVSVRPWQLRASFVTNMMLEDGFAGRRTDVCCMNKTGGWTLCSAAPMNSYTSSPAMGAAWSHVARSLDIANCV